ncbi:MAG: hypothetical protein HC932_05235, partial [Thermales bacterium]|nr:hypothetical protein [Thermales bacterium]
GFTAYVEGVGGKEKTNSNLPQEIDLNEKVLVFEVVLVGANKNASTLSKFLK